jgi:hypothetical protein
MEPVKLIECVLTFTSQSSYEQNVEVSSDLQQSALRIAVVVILISLVF